MRQNQIKIAEEIMHSMQTKAFRYVVNDRSKEAHITVGAFTSNAHFNSSKEPVRVLRIQLKNKLFDKWNAGANDREAATDNLIDSLAEILEQDEAGNYSFALPNGMQEDLEGLSALEFVEWFSGSVKDDSAQAKKRKSKVKMNLGKV